MSWVLTAAVVGGAVVGGVNYYGNKKKKFDYPELEQYSGPQETEAGGYSLPILKQRAKGGGTAFEPEILTQMQTPYAHSAWSDWQTKMKPQIEEMWATKGLGRSSMAGQSEIQAQRDVLSDVGLNWSGLMKWNEELKQRGIEGGLSGLQSYTAQELGQGNMNTSGENQRNLAQAQSDYDVKAFNRALVADSIQKGISTASSIYGGGMGGGGITGSMLSGMGQGGKGSSTSPQTFQMSQPKSIYTINNSGYNTQFLNDDALRNRYRHLIS